MKNKVVMIICILMLIIVGFCAYLNFFALNSKNQNKKTNPKDEDITSDESVSVDMEYDLIKKVNEYYSSGNYLISPMSIGYALNMLKEGADGNTLKQIDNFTKNYAINNYKLIKNRIAIANGLFINEVYKNNIKNEYIETLKNKYNSEIVFDKFSSVDVINNWVKEKTLGMIEKTIDDINENVIIALANTIAIDVEWENEFKCSETLKEDFTKQDGSKVDAVMMHENTSYDLKYFINENSKGIIKNYKIYDVNTGKDVEQTNKDTIQLEYIAILPNDLNEFINNFSLKELKNIINSAKTPNDKQEINLSIPRYKSDFSLEKFKDILIELNMADMFDSKKANFSKMSDNTKGLYVDKAIHKTAIDFNEKGTKAAAVTYFDMKYGSALEKLETIEINFNKPFIYIIKEKTSDNIWFFGVVNSPELWTSNTKTCSNYE